MKSVLVLEDNFIIAMEAEDILRSLGVGFVEIATSVRQARSLIERTTFDFAVLDVDLGSENSFEFAAGLAGMGIPFGFVSGYSDASDFPPEMRDRPRIMKPFNEVTMRSLLDTVVPPAAFNGCDQPSACQAG